MVIIELLDEDTGWQKAGELDLPCVPRNYAPLIQVAAIMLSEHGKGLSVPYLNKYGAQSARIQPPEKPKTAVRIIAHGREIHRFDLLTAQAILLEQVRL